MQAKSEARPSSFWTRTLRQSIDYGGLEVQVLKMADKDPKIEDEMIAAEEDGNDEVLLLLILYFSP